jgi:predicted DNA-binding transcriptional regulator AlpA
MNQEDVTSDIDPLLTETQAAAIAGYAPRTMQFIRQNGNGPAFVKLSVRAIRYRRKDLLAWLESRRHRQGGD